MPVWRAECRESLPRYVTAWVSQTSAVYMLGEPYTGAVRETGNASWGWERSCLDIFAKGGSYYGMGAEIPPESFVAATIRLEFFDAGLLAVRTLEAEDGSSQVAVEVNGQLVRSPELSAFPDGTFAFLGSGRLRAPSYVQAQGSVLVTSLDGFIDAQSDEPCRPERFADGLRCVPWRRVAPLSRLGPYLDAGCTTLLSETWPRSSRKTTTGGSAIAKSACSVTTAYTLGEVTTPAVVYFKRSACEPRTPLAGAVYREVFPASDSQWAPLAERME
jgi:hypothetical protein